MTNSNSPAFRFDGEAYWLGSERLTRVSEVLADVGLSDHSHVPDHALERGSVVHKACELATLGKLDWSTLHHDLHGYVNSWLSLYKALNPVLIAVERPIYHPVLKIAGTPDFVGELEGRGIIIDFKTNHVPPHTAYQLSFYDLILGPDKNGLTRKRAGVALQADGSMAKMTAFEDRNDLQTALAALTIYRAKRRK